MERAKPIFIVTKPSSLDPYDWSIKFGMRRPDGSVDVALPIGLHHVRPDEGVPDAPMMRLDCEYAEQALTSLMDSLWQAGIRPSDIGTPGHLAATQQHLNDMRAIVGRNLGIEFTKLA